MDAISHGNDFRGLIQVNLLHTLHGSFLGIMPRVYTESFFERTGSSAMKHWEIQYSTWCILHIRFRWRDKVEGGVRGAKDASLSCQKLLSPSTRRADDWKGRSQSARRRHASRLRPLVDGTQPAQVSYRSMAPWFSLYTTEGKFSVWNIMTYF